MTVSIAELQQQILVASRGKGGGALFGKDGKEQGRRRAAPKDPIINGLMERFVFLTLTNYLDEKGRGMIRVFGVPRDGGEPVEITGDDTRELLLVALDHE